MFFNKKNEKKISMDSKMEKLPVLLERLKQETKMSAYKLEIRKDGYKPNIFESKFGGVPYWDMAKAYPVDSNGEKMMLLAQINFSRENLNDERLPNCGILQFFISANDDVYGMDFALADSQANFRVVYHETIDEAVTKEQILALDIPLNTDETQDYPPITEELAISLHRETAYMGTEVCDFDELFEKIVREEFGDDVQAKSAYDFLGNEGFSELCDCLERLNANGGHWILGYPYFTQSDPRETTEYYDTLLLQIDSEMEDKKDYVMWGDCGVANFFINGEALRRKDFSKVMYNWDCC